MAAEVNVFRFTQGMFGTALDGAVAQQVQAGLAATALWMHAAGAIWLFATVYLALSRNLPLSRLFQRVLRVLLVTAIVLHPAIYTQFIVTPVITTIPNLIAQAFGGLLGAQNVPDQFAAVFNSVENLSAQLRAQATGITYIPERISINLSEFACKLLLVPQYGIWVCLHAFQLLLVIAGTVALVFYFFDKTQGFAEAWAGKIVGSLIATMLLSVVLQIIFLMNTAYMVGAQALPRGIGLNGLNISEGVSVLFNIAMVFFLGLFMSIIAVAIGFGIGRASGFDAGLIVRKMGGR